VSCLSGPKTRRINTRFTEIINTVPTPSTTASASCSVGLTVAGETASSTAADTNTPALIATTRRNSDTPESFARAATARNGRRSPSPPTVPCAPRNGRRSPYPQLRSRATLEASNEGSDMHPHMPSDRREDETPDYGATEPATDRGVTTKRARPTAAAMLIAALLVAAIIVLIFLL
jgi:hypothetical protein